jgi:hypothetical protein
MKTDAITRGYAGLTNPERAALAFTYLCDGNELEMTRIMDAVPIVRKTGMHPDYLETYDRIFLAASWWAFQHWRFSARLMAARCGRMVMADNEDRAGADKYQRIADSLESTLWGLEIALDEVGPELGLDPDAVHKLAECQPFEPMYILSPEAEHVDEAKAALRRFFQD